MKVRIEAVYETKQGTRSDLYTEPKSVKEALLIGEDMEQTGRIKKLLFLDEENGSWTKKELRKFIEKVSTEPHHIVVYFDGGFDQITKRAGLGLVIYYSQNNRSYRIRKNARVEELTTNNEAEYAALHLSMQELGWLGIERIPVTFIGDSQVVVNQLKDEWPCYDPVLNRWMDRIEDTVHRMRLSPTYQLISRKDNKEADWLASQALKEVNISSEIEIKNNGKW